MTRPFTGRHMAAILVGFFAVVLAVNVTMARFAIGTFGGTVVDNSYVASQKFNGWLAEARRQKTLGWTARVSIDPARHALVAVDAPGAVARAVARHPLGRAADIPLRFVPVDAWHLRSVQALPPGRWTLHLTVGRGGREMRLMEIVR